MPDPRALPVDTSWDFAPTIVLSVVVYAIAYAYRWRRVRAKHGPRAAGVKHLVLWMTGLLLVFVALCTPIDTAAKDLASAHMVQHLFLADLAPIALILGLTKVMLRPVTKVINTIERKAGWFGSPVFGVILYVGIMWIYHIPAVYDLALRNDGFHTVGHIGFFFAGSVYWWHLISPIRTRIRLGGMAPVAYMATTKILVGALGIGLTFYPTLIYTGYAADGTRWGMSPLDDQHVAGAIMGLEQALVMGFGLAYLFIRMLREADQADEREERYESRTVPSGTSSSPVS